MRKTKLFSLALLAAAWLAGGSALAWDVPAQDADGVYQISTASELEWYAEYVNSCVEGDTEGNNAKLLSKAVLTADIDLAGITHLPIGANTTFKFDGEFDGQFHRIKNMIINNTAENQAFFGCVRGNAIIKNIIIDKSCSITAGTRAAGLIGTLQTAADGKCRILNCVNEANVTSVSGVAAGIIGAGQSGYAFFKIHNCVNIGKIQGASNNYAAAFNGWGGNSGKGNSEVWNCYNVGELSPLDGNDAFFRGSFRSVQNCYDAVSTVYQTGVSAISAVDIANGRLCYLLNQGATEGISFKQQIGVDPYPMPVADGPLVYEVADYNCDGTPKGSVTYSNTEGGTRDPHTFVATSYYCTVCGALNETFVSESSDGFYHLSTPMEVEWFSEMVKAGYGAMKVKLDADIDYEGVADAHMPIGTSANKFFGHFDGQGHRIKGMVLTTASRLDNRGYDGNGFFGSVRGGGTATNGIVNNEVIIENLIIDASCSVQHDNNFAAGVVAHVNSRINNDSHIIIRYCGNEANISSTGKNIAGILGCVEGTEVGLTIMQCYNTGNIHGGAGESAAICGWTGTPKDYLVKVASGCWNIGEVSGIDGNGYNLFRAGTLNGELYPAIVNCVDLCTANTGNQGKFVINTTDPVASGELCYLLNGDQSNITWTQTLGTEDMPNMYGTSDRVYQAGTKNCLGEALGSVTYNNVSGETIQLDHNFNPVIGMCDVCYKAAYEEPALVDGFYEIKNAGNLEWFSHKVDLGGDANLQINGKLMNDIDMLSIENLHLPIGVSTGKKYNGTFDGQGFRIKNMIIERPTDSNIGFFGFLRGNAANTTVKNLIIDASCTIHGYNRVGGITGSCQNNGTLITIENVVNEATIIAEHQDAAGIIGGQEGNGPKWLIKNVLNTGTVTAKNEAPYAGALCCYLGGNNESVIENFVNLGTINGHRGGNIGRIAGTRTNIIDLSDTDFESSLETNYGLDTGMTSADIAGGRLAYTVGWWQELDVDAYPMPFEKAGAVVYRTGEERCDGADNENTVYSNTEGTIVTGSHDYNATTGLCDLCDMPNPDFKSLADGFYVLDNVIDMKWFAAMVHYIDPAINGKLTSDLDFENGNCRIGTDAKAYRGTFQGGDHVISNFVVDNNEIFQGLFGYVTGGADISGLVFDNTCSIKCNARGAMIGGAKDGGTVKLTRLGNEGNVTTTNENAAGIIGTDMSGACVLQIDQCYSTGTIVGGRESAQIAGWTGNNSLISNSWSCAEVTGVQSGREFSRYGGDNHGGQYVNCFTTYHETNAGLTYDTSAEDFASGKVAYTICKEAGSTIFGQAIGTDAVPTFFGPEVSYVGDAGYATLYNPSTGYELAGDVVANVARFSVSWLSLTPIDNIPAGTPVILKGTYYNKVEAELPAIDIINNLQGTDAPLEADGSQYCLAKLDDVIGFYKVTPGTIIPAGKAYYQRTSGVKVFYFDDDNATGIEDLSDLKDAQGTDGAIYNIAGQRLSKMQRGINIINGKKVLK